MKSLVIVLAILFSALGWSQASTKIEITRERSTPTILNAGNTYNMGSFGFRQTLENVNADITSLKITLTGTISPTDISGVKIYHDAKCSGAGGVLIGARTFSGSPASIWFNFAYGVTITERKSCIYLEYVIAPGAIFGSTAGVEISSADSVVNTQAYPVVTSNQWPLNLGCSGVIVGQENSNLYNVNQEEL